MYNLEKHIYDETHHLIDKEWQELTSDLPSPGDISPQEMTPRKVENPQRERHSIDYTPRPSKSTNTLFKRSFLVSESSYRDTFAVPLEKTSRLPS